ncbi:protein NDUFAF4 homolog [Microplitis demolitor]|uniref:protein NDUFAF4 homolog n=1 Tax=Microplitis demolitor TaxID=69319 RepID=UPI0004CCD350|nr:protein NDUFAF4 homolog [Microplitis demolitor]XP_008549230.1 protein NDUFAF4 homolog [Microplitis demolitor]XP_008549231.1 protein NDUFAF4 homolog [Microplitis demolitor]
MNKIMGIIMSRLSKPIRTFNIENRAGRVLGKDKPLPAPTYPSTAQQLKIAQEVNPDFLKNHYKKDEELYDRLKQVFVSSQAQPEVTDTEKLPKNKRWVTEFDYGFWEPETVPAGRCQLRTVMKFMGDYELDPKKNSVQEISLKYNLDPADVANIIEYYRVFQVIVPKEGKMYVPRNDVKTTIADK